MYTFSLFNHLPLLLSLFNLILLMSTAPLSAANRTSTQVNKCHKKYVELKPLISLNAIASPLPPMPLNMLGELKSPAIKKNLIVIDAGHGGEDFGTHSNSKPIYHEKNLNLATAYMLNNFLNQMGYKTMMVRQGDIFISLEKRAEIANENKAALFVSVHFNSAPSKEAKGIEIFFYPSNLNAERTRQSYLLAETVLKQMTKDNQIKSRGIKKGNFAVTRLTDMTAILIEGGFMTNDEEMENLKNAAYLKRLAWNISKGIDNYCHK